MKIEDLYCAMEDNSVDVIVCSQGGEKSIELLDRLDFARISHCKKPIFGQSDITSLLNVISLKCKIYTYYGLDMIWGLGKNAKDYTMNQFKEFMTYNKLNELHPFDKEKWDMIVEGEAEGILLGGCLTSFNLLLGTTYDPLMLLEEDCIIFLEDIGESFERLAALMSQLALQENINKCKGIVLGNFLLCSSENPSITLELVAKHCFAKLGIPILRIPEIGHGVENMILPIGARVRMTATPEKYELSIL